jgi:chromosome segregation ATPase
MRTFKIASERSTIVVTSLTQEPKNRAADDEGAWLEEALLLAASELSAFRAIALAERERMQRAHDVTRARVQALEEQHRQGELRHANELAEARTLLEVQLGQRAKAWVEFSRDLAQRMAAVHAIKLQHAHAIEEAGAVRRQLHEVRSALEAAQARSSELEAQLAKHEESFVTTAQVLQQLRAEAARLHAQRDEAAAALDASVARQSELAAERDTLVQQSSERAAAASDAASKLEQATAAQTALRERISALEQTGREHAQLKAALGEARQQQQALEQQLARVRDEAVQARLGSQTAALSAEHSRKAVEAADELAKQAHAGMLAARRERDEAKQALEAKFKDELAGLRAESDQTRAQRDQLQAERDQLRAEIDEQASTRWALLDLEKQRSAKLKLDLDQLRAELEPVRADRERLKDEVAVLGADREQLQGELEQLRLERDQLAAEIVAMDSAPAAAVDGRAVPPDPRPSARDYETVPIPIADKPAANQASGDRAKPPARSRQNTSYSYSEVAEEQVFVPSLRSPTKGGGRGGQ